jgi:hypothetical protein
MKAMHGRLLTLTEKNGYDIRRFLDASSNRSTLFSARIGQDVIDHFIVPSGMTDADPQAEKLASQVGNDILEAVVSAGSTATLQSHRSDREVQIVMDHHHRFRRYLQVGTKALDRVSAAIHESGGLEQSDFAAVYLDPGQFTLESTFLLERTSVTFRKDIHEPESRIMASVLVTSAWIAQARNDPDWLVLCHFKWPGPSTDGPAWKIPVGSLAL